MSYGCGMWTFVRPSKMSAISVPDSLCGPVLAPSELVSYECGATFASRTALAVHSRILHGSINAADQRVTGTSCLRGRKQYHSRPRLVAHLQRGSAECLAAYLDHVPPLDVGDYRALKKADASTRKHKKSLGLTNLHADLPAVRVAGPMLPPFPSPMPAAPRLEVHRGNDFLQDVSLPQPCAPCQQFILCPYVEHRKEGDFQAQVELLFAMRRQDGGSALRGFFGCPAPRPTVSLPVHPWNATSCPSQQVRSMNNAWGKCGLALAPFQILRTVNFFVQCSLLLMLAAQTARVPSLWCHPSPTDGSLFLSLGHLPEIRWVLSPGHHWTWPIIRSLKKML